MSNEVSAQSTRSLSGTLSIDIGTNEIDRNIEITVNNHSFVVLPSLAFIRPITSSETAIVALPAGSSQLSYTINNIISDPVDYSVRIRCLGCSVDIPTQYYTTNGNAFGLVDSAYIDPNNLPTTLNLTAISRARITGTITLDQIADRDLRFRVSVLGSDNTERIFGVLNPIIMRSGTSSVSYSIGGLRRNSGSDQYRVQLECLNCVGSSRSAQFFARVLSPTQNHNRIDFAATNVSIPILAPIIELVLE